MYSRQFGTLVRNDALFSNNLTDLIKIDLYALLTKFLVTRYTENNAK